MSASALDLPPLRLDDKDFIFADNNLVAMKDTTIADLIECVLAGATVDSASNTDCDSSGLGNLCCSYCSH